MMGMYQGTEPKKALGGPNTTTCLYMPWVGLFWGVLDGQNTKPFLKGEAYEQASEKR